MAQSEVWPRPKVAATLQRVRRYEIWVGFVLQRARARAKTRAKGTFVVYKTTFAKRSFFTHFCLHALDDKKKKQQDIIPELVDSSGASSFLPTAEM